MLERPILLGATCFPNVLKPMRLICTNAGLFTRSLQMIPQGFHMVPCTENQGQIVVFALFWAVNPCSAELVGVHFFNNSAGRSACEVTLYFCFFCTQRKKTGWLEPCLMFSRVGSSTRFVAIWIFVSLTLNRTLRPRYGYCNLLAAQCRNQALGKINLPISIVFNSGISHWAAAFSTGDLHR